MANNIVLQPSAGDTLVLTAVASSITWGATAGSTQGSAVYTGTISGGASNGLANQAFTIAGFTNLNNNGRFLCLSSTATTITLNNVFAAAETHAATATYNTQGFPTQYSTKIEKLMTTNQGDNVYVYPGAGDTLVAIAIGLKSLWPFDQLHGASPAFGYLQGLNDFNANPTISDHSTTASTSPVSIALGSAANFALLGASTVTNSGSTTVNGGNLGLYPGTSVTGFPPGIFAPGYGEQIANTIAGNAQSAASAAYTYFTGLPVTLALTTADIGTGGTQHSVGAPNGTYYPGVYVSASSIDIATPVTLDAQGASNAVFVFYAPSSTITQALAGTITLLNGALASNVVWVAGSSFTSVGAATSVGTIIGHASVTLGGGTLAGRAIALTGAVTISTGTAITTTGSNGGGNNWELVANIDLVDSDYTPSATPPVAPNPWPSSQWSLDGYYPSLYVWVCAAALPGPYNVNLNSVYQDGISAPQDLAAGKPIFDGGVNFQVLRLTGAAEPEVSFTIGTSTSALATSGPITTTAADGDALISIALMKSGNVFAPGTVGTGGVAGTGAAMSQVASGKLVGSEAHYMVEYALTAPGSAGSFNPSFSNPLGYEMVVCNIALLSS